MTLEQLQALLEILPPWVQALELRAHACEAAGVTLRLPQNKALAIYTGTLSGQAMLAAADTAMVLALAQDFGAFRPCSTVQLSSSFLRPLSGQDALVQARLLRVGKTLAFGEVDIRGAEDGKIACRASTTFALL